MSRVNVMIAILAFAAIAAMPGCSTQRETTTTTTSQPAQNGTSPEQTNQSTTTTTTNDDAGHSSLVGATGNFIWTVVAFPFRVVGDAIGEII